jgi:hypothetical protein
MKYETHLKILNDSEFRNFFSTHTTCSFEKGKFSCINYFELTKKIRRDHEMRINSTTETSVELLKYKFIIIFLFYTSLFFYLNLLIYFVE